MKENKDSFILYNSFYDPIKSMKNEQLGKLFRSIFNYTINGEIPQDDEIIIAFMFIKTQIDINNEKWKETKEKRSEAGKKGMASRWHNKDNNVITNHNKNNNVINDITKITVNDNVNVNVNDNVNVKNNNKYIVVDNSIIEIINYLNLRTGQHYKYSTNKTKTLIKARLKEKFTIDDFKEVIDKMCVEWMNTDMQKYLRPETLFGTKFESYLNREVKQTTKNMSLSSEDISKLFG